MNKRKLHPFLFAFFAFLLLFNLFLFWHAKDDALKGSADLSSFYAAVRMVRSGHGSQLYNIAAQGRAQSRLFPNIPTRRGTLLFLHPPFEALLYLPLAYVSYPTAYALWGIVNILILLLTVALLSPYMKELKAVWTPLPVLLFVAFFPVFIDLLQGQDSICLLFVYALAFRSLEEGHDVRGGFFLGLGLFKFQYTLPFLVPFLLWRCWKVIGGAAVASAFLFLLSLPIAGFQGILSYATFLLNLVNKLSSMHVQHVVGILSNTMPNIHGAVEMMTQHVLSPTAQKAAIILLSGAAVLWVVKKWPLGRSPSGKTFDLGFSLALVASILVSYHLLLHDLSLLLIPFIVVLERILKADVYTGRRRFLMVGLIALFFLSPLYLLLMKHSLMYLLFWPILFFYVLLSRELVSPDLEPEQAGGEKASGSVNGLA